MNDQCDNCKYKKIYTTRLDEYPGLTAIEYCQKGHWEDSNREPEPGQYSTVWDDCKDFMCKTE